MHPNMKGLRKPDFAEHPAEKELLKTVGQAHGIDAGLVRDARASGVPWPTILGWLAQFGPHFNDALQAILGALHTPPPVAPPAAEAADETAEK